jgi:hypothetical protein
MEPLARDLELAVLRAVVYADLFDAPLSLAELLRALPGCATDAAGLSAVLREPFLTSRLEQRRGLVFLRGRGEVVARRQRARRRTEALVERHRGLLRLMAHLPFVRLLAFSGGTSHKNSVSGEDIDLFVVSAPGRSWLTFALFSLATRLAGERRVMCFNYIVDERHLRVPNAGDLFTAHQLVCLKPLRGRRLAQRLLDENPWARQLYPNASALEPADVIAGESSRWQRAVELGLGPLWWLGEHLSRGALGRRLRKKIDATADVVLAPGLLKLHYADHRMPTARRFRQRLVALGAWDPALEALLPG